MHKKKRSALSGREFLFHVSGEGGADWFFPSNLIAFAAESSADFYVHFKFNC